MGTIDGLENDVVIANHGRDIVIRLGADAVPAVVPEIVDHQVEVVREQRPERIVEIGGETAAVAQDDSEARRIARARRTVVVVSASRRTSSVERGWGISQTASVVMAEGRVSSRRRALNGDATWAEI